MKQLLNIKEVPVLRNLGRSEELARYYNDVKNYKILSREEELNLFKIIRGDNPILAKSARDKLIQCNQRFVIGVAKKYTNGEDLLDLIEEGNIGLMACIDTFNPDKGNKFITWAVWFIRRSIIFYRINSTLIKKSNVNRTYHAIAEASNKFLQTYERLPSDEELISIIDKEYGIKITNIDDIFNTSVTYIDSSMNDDEDNTTVGDGYSEFNRRCASSNIYEHTVENESNKHLALALINKLKKREKIVISMLYGIGYEREYSIQEISNKLNLSTERVRQISVGALVRLKYRASKIRAEIKPSF